MAMKKQAAPQRVSQGVYRMPGGNLRQMQAPRPQQQPPMKGQPVPQRQFPMSPPLQGPAQPIPGQYNPNMGSAQNFGQNVQMPQAPMQDPRMMGFQGPVDFNQYQQAQQMMPNLQDYSQMARNDMRMPSQYGQGMQTPYMQADPQRMQQMQQAMQYYQQNPQAIQQTQQGMQTLMPQASRQILRNEGAGLLSKPPGEK